MKFFARFVILVGGETEGLALPEYLAVVGLDCDQKGVSIIAVLGEIISPSMGVCNDYTRWA